jgi:CRP-like cAMP-binding protein
MFGIVSGSVTLHKGSVVVASLGPNDVFGERALIDHLPRNLTAIATSASTLLRSTDATSSFWCTNHRRSPWAS